MPNNFPPQNIHTSTHPKKKYDRPLSGKALIDALNNEFPHISRKDYQQIQFSDPQFTITYIWCQPVMKFVQFLHDSSRHQSMTSYHDAMKFFIAKTQLHEKTIYELRVKNQRIDLVEPQSHLASAPPIYHEIKTAEMIEKEMFRTKFLTFLRQIRDGAPLRQSWWLAYLHECKNINKRECFKFIGIIHINAADIEGIRNDSKKRQNLTNRVVACMETLEQKIIKKENIKKEELWNDSLFGVPNQITESLRRHLDEKDAALEEKNAALEEQSAALKEKDAALEEQSAALKEKDAALEEQSATLKEKDAEIERLKKVLHLTKKK